MAMGELEFVEASVVAEGAVATWVRGGCSRQPARSSAATQIGVMRDNMQLKDGVKQGGRNSRESAAQRSIAIKDSLIASTALTHDLTVVTRNPGVFGTPASGWKIRLPELGYFPMNP